MFSTIFQDFFNEADRLANELTKKMSEESYKKECKKDECSESPSSYYHFVSDEYVNGEHVAHEEKEVKDGNVIKNEGYNCRVEDKKCKSCENKPELQDLKAEIEQMKAENEKLQKENEMLNAKLNNIRKLF